MDYDNDWYIRADEILKRFIKKPKNRLLISILLEDMFPHDVEDRMYVIYEMFCDDLCGIRKNLILNQLRERRIIWNHPAMDRINYSFQEMDDFITKPPDVEEGVIQCKKCKGLRTLSCSKQTRRADESATVFVKCVECNASFRL